MTDALQRQLENDEPKCGNCKHWNNWMVRAERTSFGRCEHPVNDLQMMVATPHPFTADLTVCSKWAPKD